MKNALFVALAFLLSIYASPAHAFEAEYRGFDLYQGDGGDFNICRSDEILVREYYLVRDEQPDNLILISTSPSGGLWARFVTGYLKGSGYIDSNYCQSVEQLEKGKKKQTRFMNSSGEKSNIIEFSIYYDSKNVLKSSQWGRNKRVSIKNRMKKNKN